MDEVDELLRLQGVDLVRRVEAGTAIDAQGVPRQRAGVGVVDANLRVLRGRDGIPEQRVHGQEQRDAPGTACAHRGRGPGDGVKDGRVASQGPALEGRRDEGRQLVASVGGEDRPDVSGLGAAAHSREAPLEDLSLWIDFTMQWNRDGGDGGELEGERYGLALAGRYAVTERLGVALRGEWLRDDPDKDKLPVVFVDGPEFDQFAITGTIDFALTNHLQLRSEVRYDWADSDARIFVPGTGLIPLEQYYWKGNGRADTNQTVALVEAIYTF